MFGHLVCLVGLGKSKRYSNPLKWPGDCHFRGKFEENSIQLLWRFQHGLLEGENSGSSIFETCAMFDEKLPDFCWTGRIAVNHKSHWNDGHEVLGPAVTWYSLLAHGPRYVPPKKKEVIGHLGGGNSKIFGIFTPKIGEDEPNLINIFQMGWNHQPELPATKKTNHPFCWNLKLYELSIARTNASKVQKKSLVDFRVI